MLADTTILGSQELMLASFAPSMPRQEENYGASQVLKVHVFLSLLFWQTQTSTRLALSTRMKFVIGIALFTHLTLPWAESCGITQLLASLALSLLLVKASMSALTL